MTTPAVAPDVPMPAGATEVHDWKPEDEGTCRHFWGTETDFEVAPEPCSARVGYRSFAITRVAGTQWADGTTKRWIEVDASGHLTARDARKLATNLLAAADQLDEPGHTPA